MLSPRSALPTQDSEVNTAHLFIPYCLINTFLLEIYTWAFFPQFCFYTSMPTYLNFFMTFCTLAMVFQASVLHLMWAVAVVVVRSLKWSSEPCCVGPPKTDASLFRVMTKCDPLEEGMANDPSILAMRTSWTVLKGKKVWQWKMSPPGWKVSDILQGKKGELLIALERMKRLGQSGSDAQLWMSGDENKIWCCKEQYCIGTWNIRSIHRGKLDTSSRRW